MRLDNKASEEQWSVAEAQLRVAQSLELLRISRVELEATRAYVLRVKAEIDATWAMLRGTDEASKPLG
jgi:hypothetical protein